MSTLETERLVLRPWVDDDLDALTAIFAEPDFWRYPFGRGFTSAETERFLDRQLDHWATHGFGVWAAELKGDVRLIGYIGLATEGGRASLRYGFEELGLDRIISIFAPDNVASGHVMAKLGMTTYLTTTDPERGIVLEVREISRAAWQVSQA